MRMLRNFEYKPDIDLIIEILEQFEVALPRPIAVVRFEVITPDSFMWRLLIGDAVYYLYAEDYVESIDHRKHIFDEYLDKNEWVLVKPREAVSFEDSSPVRGAAVYRKSPDADELMRYAV